MTRWQESALVDLLEGTVGARRTEALAGLVDIHPALLTPRTGPVPRGVLAMAMDLLLFEDLLRRVPASALYVQQQVREGRKIVYDHGALRTVLAPSGALPQGHLAFARILEPLGYQVNGIYPLELPGHDRPGLRPSGPARGHPPVLRERAPSRAVLRRPSRRSRPGSCASAKDPLPCLDPADPGRAAVPPGTLPTNRRGGSCPTWWPASTGSMRRPPWPTTRPSWRKAPRWPGSPRRGTPSTTPRTGYRTWWRCPAAQKALGRPMKDEVEVSTSGRVLQTAYKAAQVERAFVEPDGRLVLRTVPGSFFEFITRKPEAGGSPGPALRRWQRPGHLQDDRHGMVLKSGSQDASSCGGAPAGRTIHVITFRREHGESECGIWQCGTGAGPMDGLGRARGAGPLPRDPVLHPGARAPGEGAGHGPGRHDPGRQPGAGDLLVGPGRAGSGRKMPSMRPTSSSAPGSWTIPPRPLSIPDLQQDPELAGHPSARRLGIRTYLGSAPAPWKHLHRDPVPPELRAQDLRRRRAGLRQGRWPSSSPGPWRARRLRDDLQATRNVLDLTGRCGGGSFPGEPRHPAAQSPLPRRSG